MKVIKRIKQSNYTTISNSFLRNNELSLKAKAVLATIMSLPDDWDFSIKGLVSIVKEGDTAIRSAINELMAAEYCKVEIIRDGTKFSKWTYYFREDLNIPFEEKPCMENPQMGNQTQINKENKENTKENKEVKNNIKDIDIDKKTATEEEKRFTDYMMKNFPHVCNMSCPMTLAEYKKLLDMHYSPQQIEDKLYVLENKKEYTKKYRSPYLCVRNWLKADNPRV